MMVTKELFPELDSIIAAKRYYLAERKRKTPIEAIRALASMQKRPLPLLNTVTSTVVLIAQIRYGENHGDYDPVSTAVCYAREGVNAISLFTDDTMYAGGVDDLMFVSGAVQAFDVPVISQDYIFDEYQIVEARAAGASGVVLAANLVDSPTLRTLVSATQRNRMTAIVKISNEEELNYALSLSPQAIAISNRDPQTRRIDLDFLRKLRMLIPSHVRLAVTGGLRSAEDVANVVSLGVNAVLLSETFFETCEMCQLQSLLHGPAAAV